MIYVAIFCLALLVYSYLGFPLLVAMLAKLCPNRLEPDSNFRPSVSIILPAHNEELVLRRCLASLLSLNYPKDKIEILCGSDGSTDSTNDILKEHARLNSFFRIFLFSSQRGKILTLNDLVNAARNEILLFVDADVILCSNALIAHVQHYVNSQVGGVAGELQFESTKHSGVFISESSYWSLETSLRRNEGLVDSTLGLYGGNYSMRRSLWKPIPDRWMYDDFFAALNLLSQRVRIIYEPTAIAIEKYGRTHEDEYARKKRNAYYSLRTLKYFWKLIFAPRTAWMVWPHKILRWESGPIVIVLVLSAFIGFLNHERWASTFFSIEIFCAIAVIVGFVGELIHKPIPVATQAFWLINIQRAGLAGTIAFLFNGTNPAWTQTTRVADPSQDAMAIKERAQS